MNQLNKLATVVEQWILQFCVDFANRKQCVYVDIPPYLWDFIWICIRHDLNANHVLPYPLEKYFTEQCLLHVEFIFNKEWTELQNVTNEFIKTTILQPRLLKYIQSFSLATPFTIHHVDENKKESRQQLHIMTVSPGMTQDYSVFLQCLFQDDFARTSLFTAGNDREMTSLQYTKKRKPVEAYTYWWITHERYQECLYLFPLWPLRMSAEWFLHVRQMCQEYLIPDLVSMCFEFL